MVEILQNSFISRMNDQDITDDHTMYSMILSDLEDAGMAPPVVLRIYYNTWRDGGSGRVWEPEDDK
jgi:hypothetical protein